nr:hypothetical protein [Tanacetum cinerariifolium]
MDKVKLNLLIVMAMAMMVVPMEATTLSVGDSIGWIRPASPLYYLLWGITHNVSVGDVLFFNFTTGYHNVVQVKREAFLACDASDPIISYTDGPAYMDIPIPDQYYIICSISDHCQAGQRFVANVPAPKLL